MCEQGSDVLCGCRSQCVLHGVIMLLGQDPLSKTLYPAISPARVVEVLDKFPMLSISRGSEGVLGAMSETRGPSIPWKGIRSVAECHRAFWAYSVHKRN